MNKQGNEVVVTDQPGIVGADGTTAEHLGTAVAGGTMVPIVPAGAHTPHSITHAFAPSDVRNHGEKPVSGGLFAAAALWRYYL